jgi:hypothetical protein
MLRMMADRREQQEQQGHGQPGGGGSSSAGSSSAQSYQGRGPPPGELSVFSLLVADSLLTYIPIRAPSTPLCRKRAGHLRDTHLQSGRPAHVQVRH